MYFGSGLHGNQLDRISIDRVANQNSEARMGGLSNPSMILCQAKLIEKVGPIKGGNQAFNRTREAQVELYFANTRLDLNQQRLVLQKKAYSQTMLFTVSSQTLQQKQ